MIDRNIKRYMSVKKAHKYVSDKYNVSNPNNKPKSLTKDKILIVGSIR